jgi:putative Mg2+ transporter-C (MgtC) family protein
MEFDGDAIVRLLAALGLGALIGIEREVADQPAGLRTHIAVCLGACLFGVISTLGFEEFFARRETTNVQVDVTRVASQVVVGIGFIGAGMIFRQGSAVKNLTTAASLWATSAVGLAVGVGNLLTGAAAAAILLVSLIVLRPLRTWIHRRVSRDTFEARVELREGVEPDDVMTALRDLQGVTVGRMSVEKSSGNYVVVAALRGEPHVDVADRFSEIARRDDVETAGERESEATTD